MTFAILEKNGEKKAVYSAGDLAYMLLRGWKKAELIAAPAADTPEPPKKRGRPAKAK